MIQFDERAYFSKGLVKNHQLDRFFFQKSLLKDSLDFFWELLSLKVIFI